MQPALKTLPSSVTVSWKFLCVPRRASKLTLEYVIPLPWPLGAGPAVMSMADCAVPVGWRSVRLSEVKLLRPPGTPGDAAELGEGSGGVDVVVGGKSMLRKSRAYGGSGWSVMTERCRTGEGCCCAGAIAADVPAAAAAADVGDDKEAALSESSDSLELMGLVRQEESLEKLPGFGLGGGGRGGARRSGLLKDVGVSCCGWNSLC